MVHTIFEMSGEPATSPKSSLRIKEVHTVHQEGPMHDVAHTDALDFYIRLCQSRVNRQ